MKYFAELENAINKNDIQTSKEIANAMLESGISYKEILDSIVAGLNGVGNKYKNGEYFIADLIVAGMNVQELLSMVKLKTYHQPEVKKSEKVVIGTIFEDIHDIGKDLVVNALSAYGYNIIDLGVDVSVERFMDAIREYKPRCPITK